MGTPISPAVSLLKVATDTAGTPGTYATAVDVTGFSADHGAEDPSETFVFGETVAHSRGGDNTDDYSIDALFNVADTTGQQILKTSRDTGVHCWVQILHNGTAGYSQKVNVVSYSESAERDGDWVLISFSARGVAGTKVAVP